VFSKKISDGFFGVCVGEALGLPVDCRSRKYLEQNPVTDFEGFGTYNLPPGTWSDGSSLTFCTAEAFITGYNLERIAEKFILWRDTGYWTPNGELVGKWNHNADIVQNLKQRVSGAFFKPRENGEPNNFSLLWVLPLAYVTYGLSLQKRAKVVREVVNFIDGNPLSIIGAVMYNEMAIGLLDEKPIQDAVVGAQEAITKLYGDREEFSAFSPVFGGRIISLTEPDLRASNNLIDTLIAAVWVLLHGKNYRETLLAAVNLGEDTDSLGAVTGGLAGIAFGYESIPGAWVQQVARKKDIEELILRFTNKMEAWEARLQNSSASKSRPT
jgi:ADP-ribosyl-[dinitrogen reductase] hydrolase